MEKLKLEQMVITPEIAEEMLKHNINNRRIKQRRVNEYAQMMKSGRYILNTDCIGFDTNGNLINGQHRLTACVKSGVKFESIVARGFSTITYEVLDQGVARTSSDIAKNDGAHIRCSTSLASIKLIVSIVDKVDRGEIGNIIKVDMARRYEGISMLCYEIKCMGGYLSTSAPSTTAMVMAMINGVQLEQIKSFVLVGRNEVVSSSKYNNKAALDYIDFKRGYSDAGGGKPQKLLYEECKKAIYMFTNNIRKTCRDNLYPVTHEMLEAFNDKMVEHYGIQKED